MKKREEIKDKYKWDLKRIYKTEEEFNEDLNSITFDIDKIKDYEGTIMSDSETLLSFLKLNEEVSYKLSKLVVYSNLKFYENSKNDETNQVKLKVDNIMNYYHIKTSFVLTELQEKDYKELLTNDELIHYEFVFEKITRSKKHILPKDKEELINKALNEMGEGSNAYYHLNNTDSDFGLIKVNNKEEKLTRELYQTILSKHKRSLRKEAMERMHKYYEEREHTITSLYKSILNEFYFVKDVRGYKDVLNMDLYHDNIDEEVYDNLIKVVNNNLDSFHKYLNLKRQYFGYKELHLYDLNKEVNIEKDITYDKAKEIVISSLKPLGDDYINIINKSFNESWIDVYPNEGKSSGAFQWGIYKTPYIMLNYNNRLEDVFTLTHELGHAAHTYLSDHKQSMTYSSYPIFLAEIASTVNEILLFKHLYKNSNNKEDKIKYLFEFLDSFRGTVFRQTMFSEFEHFAHSLKENNEVITNEILNNYYYDLNNKYFKDLKIDKFIKYEWMRVPHFYTPYYVYKYATGFLSAILIAFNLDSNKYIEFLESGESKYPLETLKLAGVDLTNENNLNEAFKYFDKYLNELNELLGDTNEQ